MSLASLARFCLACHGQPGGCPECFDYVPEWARGPVGFALMAEPVSGPEPVLLAAGEPPEMPEWTPVPPPIPEAPVVQTPQPKAPKPVKPAKRKGTPEWVPEPWVMERGDVVVSNPLGESETRPRARCVGQWAICAPMSADRRAGTRWAVVHRATGLALVKAKHLISCEVALALILREENAGTARAFADPNQAGAQTRKVLLGIAEACATLDSGITSGKWHKPGCACERHRGGEEGGGHDES